MPDALFIRYLTQVQRVLNGEAFLLHFLCDAPIGDGPGLFEVLLDAGVITALLREYYELVEAGHVQDEELFFYREERLPLPGEALPARAPERVAATELTVDQFRGLLRSTLDAERRELGHFTSFYRQQLAPADASARVEALEAVWSQLASTWRYHWVDRGTFILDAADPTFFFDNLGNDACVLFHDDDRHLFVLLTNGTD